MSARSKNTEDIRLRPVFGMKVRFLLHGFVRSVLHTRHNILVYIINSTLAIIQVMRSDYNQIPVVTVLMSVYNGEKYLRQAIDSILNQTLRDFEFVIYDDCSNDSTAEIINSYSDTRIVYRRNSSNKGLTANLADGVKRSAARYIARMDADDVAYSNRLKRQVEWMDVHPEITILGTPVKYFSVSPGDGALSEQPQDDATIKARLFIDFTLMHPSIMIRRDDLVNRGINYNTDFRYSQDHALYLIALCKD